MERARHALLVTLSVAALATGCGSPQPAPASAVPTAATRPTAADPPLDRGLAAICPTSAPRPRGTYADVRAITGELAATETPDAARAILCRQAVSERAFAHGLYYLAMRQLRAGDAAGGLATLELAADRWAEPLALAKLAAFHHAGPERIREGTGLELPVARDVGRAYCEAWAAMTLSNGLRVAEDDRAFHTRVVGAVLGLVDAYETPAIRAEWSPQEHREETLACVAAHRARYEASFGALPSDADVRAHDAPPPLRGGAWEGRVTTADGPGGVAVGDACRAVLTVEAGARCRAVVDCGATSLYPGDAARETGGFVRCAPQTDGSTGGEDDGPTSEDGDPAIRLVPAARQLRVQDDGWLVQIQLAE